MKIDESKLEPGSIKALFPNLGTKIIANGCLCEIVGAFKQEIKVIILETCEGSMYKVGTQIWVDSFLIERL